MSGAIFVSKIPAFKNVTILKSTRGPFDNAGIYPISRQRLPGDSIGICSVTLVDVVIGSRIRIEVFTSGAEVTTIVASSDTISLSIPFYASGNVSNDLRVKIRNASSTPTYQPYETRIQVGLLPQTIFINQLLDE